MFYVSVITLRHESVFTRHALPVGRDIPESIGINGTGVHSPCVVKIHHILQVDSGLYSELTTSISDCVLPAQAFSHGSVRIVWYTPVACWAHDVIS